MLSGGFDPIHPGHLSLIKKASKYGVVHIALNSDDWLIRKKGFFFQSFDQRKAILESLRYVNKVVEVDDSDGTVCKALEKHLPDYFGNGGDRKADNTPEVQTCSNLGISLIWNLDDPSTRDFHSSFFLSKKRVERTWGYYDVLLDEPWCKVKRLVINPGKQTSMQFHRKRHEYMFTKDGKVVHIPPEQIHVLENGNEGTLPLEIIEVQTGVCEESDITRVNESMVGTWK